MNPVAVSSLFVFSNLDTPADEPPSTTSNTSTDTSADSIGTAITVDAVSTDRTSDSNSEDDGKHHHHMSDVDDVAALATAMPGFFPTTPGIETASAPPPALTPAPASRLEEDESSSRPSSTSAPRRKAAPAPLRETLVTSEMLMPLNTDGSGNTTSSSGPPDPAQRDRAYDSLTGAGHGGAVDKPVDPAAVAAVASAGRADSSPTESAPAGSSAARSANINPTAASAVRSKPPKSVRTTAPPTTGVRFESPVQAHKRMSMLSDDDRPATGSSSSPAENRRRTQYFEERFQYKDHAPVHVGTARDRIQKDSPVVAWLRTNVIVKDEFTLVTDLSYQLSTRYSRPESSIMINVDHSACLLLAGSFEPAYILTISALPAHLQPVSNKRNAAMIQAFMAEALSVPADRGILRFNPIADADLAINGTTIFGDIERLEEATGTGEKSKRGSAAARKSASGATSGGLTAPIRKSILRGSSSTSIPRSTTSAPATTQTLPPSPTKEQAAAAAAAAEKGSSTIPLPPVPPTPQDDAEDASSRRGLGKRKSLTAMVTGRKAGHARTHSGATEKTVETTATAPAALQAAKNLPAPPPIPMERPQRVSRRKSFLSVFRR